MIYEKIEKAKKGNTVIIYPCELCDPYVPLTLDDLIGVCNAFNMPYTVTDTSFTITGHCEERSNLT